MKYLKLYEEYDSMTIPDNFIRLDSIGHKLIEMFSDETIVNR